MCHFVDIFIKNVNCKQFFFKFKVNFFVNEFEVTLILFDQNYVNGAFLWSESTWPDNYLLFLLIHLINMK